jgi:probable F420-dependent oxidoreductase
VCTEIGGVTPREAVELGVLAERLGYDDIWTSESGGPDGIAPLASIAARTERIRLGTAILPIFQRTPALTAMTAATLQELSGGRFVLGLGLSTRFIVERWLGRSFERPLLQYREYVTVVRGLICGEKVDYCGATLAVRGFRLRAATEPRVPVLMAALGPRACRLAGELADGVIFYLKSPAGVRQSLAWVREGAEATGRDPSELECALMINVVPDTAVTRSVIAAYARVPEYARSLRLQGFADAIDAIAAAWPAGSEHAARAVDDTLIDGLTLPLDRAAGRRLLAEFAAAGVTSVMLLPTTTRNTGVTGFDNAVRTLQTFAPRTDTLEVVS